MAATLLLTGSLQADTFTLKTGEKIEGKLLSETTTDITIEFHETASITDTRTVPKTDIQEIQKEAPDEAAYATVKEIKAGPSSITAAAYDIQAANLKNFIATYPKSSHVSEIQKNLTAIEADQKRVKNGEFKLNNRWLTQDQVQTQRIQIIGESLLGSMQDQVRRRNLVGAMNTFDELQKNASGSASYPTAVESARQILPALKSTAENMLQTWKIQKEERDKAVESLAEPQKTNTLAAIDREDKQATALLEAAQKAQTAWPPLLSHSETALEAISTKASEMSNTLAEIPVQKMQRSIAASTSAKALLKKGDLAGAETALAQADTLWPENEASARLRADLATAKSIAETPATEDTAPVPVEKETPPPAAVPVPTEVVPTTVEEVAPALEHTNFFLTPVGIVSVILGAIFISAAVSVFKKVRARANDVLE